MNLLFNNFQPKTVDAEHALRGRSTPVLKLPADNIYFKIDLAEVPAGSEVAYFALGCFWGAEKLYWQTNGVTNTGVGYQGGYTPNPTYDEVCSGQTGHAETVRVCFDPKQVSYADLLKVFYENHDPTQKNRQGNDIGTQYRSAIFTTSDAQAETAREVTAKYQQAFTSQGFGEITTQLQSAPDWYFAELDHQEYLLKNPNGYCPIHATGVKCA